MDYVFCTDAGCWTELADTHNFNGELAPATSVRACQDACWHNDSCDGFDWNPGQPVGQQCWLSGPWTSFRNITQPGITLYILNRDDCRKFAV